MSELLAAFALAMIFEGMMPFIAPKGWREMVLKISRLADNQLRQMGFVIMLTGLALLWSVR